METATALPHGRNDRTQISNHTGRTTIQFEGRIYLPSLRPLVHENGFMKAKGFHSHIDVLQNMRAGYRQRSSTFTTRVSRQYEASRQAVRLQLRGVSPLSDAVLCLRDYEDPAVQVEIDILLGHDRDAAWQLIHLWRVRGSKASFVVLAKGMRLSDCHFGSGLHIPLWINIKLYLLEEGKIWKISEGGWYHRVLFTVGELINSAARRRIVSLGNCAR